MVFKWFSKQISHIWTYSLVRLFLLLIIGYAQHSTPSLCNAKSLRLPLHRNHIWQFHSSLVPHRFARLTHYNFDLFLLIAEVSTVSAEQDLRSECLRLVWHLLLRHIVPLRDSLREMGTYDLLADLNERTCILVALMNHLLVLKFLLLHLVELVLLKHPLLKFELI
jgi:hypothetical protein